MVGLLLLQPPPPLLKKLTPRHQPHRTLCITNKDTKLVGDSRRQRRAGEGVPRAAAAVACLIAANTEVRLARGINCVAMNCLKVG